MAKNRTEKSYMVSQIIFRMGYPKEFADIVGTELNTDFTAKMMLGYLRDGNPKSMEDIADEMLGILEFRDRLTEKYK